MAGYPAAGLAQALTGGRRRNLVCVAGATSQVGVFLLPRLRSAGFRILALSRQAPLQPLEVAPGVTWLRTSFLADGERLDQVMALPSPDCLVSCGPLDLAARLLLRHPGLRRAVVFSSSSVLSKAESRDAPERDRMREMAASEAGLRQRCAEVSLPLLLLRPTLIYGCGMDANVSRLARLAARYGVLPLAGAAAGLRQPVHADDLAQLAVQALLAATPGDFEAFACGGSTLSYREMVLRVAALQMRRVRTPALPEGLLAVLLGLAGRLSGRSGLNAEMARRQNRDLVFDDHLLRERLGWNPRPFEPTAADFAVPAHCRELQLPV